MAEIETYVDEFGEDRARMPAEDPASTTKARDELALQQATVASSAGESPYGIYQRYQEAKTDEQFLDTWKQDVVDRRAQRFEEQAHLAQSYGIDPEAVIGGEVNQAKEDLTKPVESFETFRQQVYSMEDMANLPAEDKDNIALAQYFRYRMQQLNDEVSTGEFIASLPAGGVRQSFSVNDLVENLGFDKDWTFSDHISAAVNPGSVLVMLKDAVNSLPVKQRATLFERFNEGLIEEGANDSIRSDIMRKIFVDGINVATENLWHYFDVADIAAMGGVAVKAVAKTAKAGETLNVAKKLKNENIVKDASDIAKADAEAGTAIGAAPADLADASNPMVHGDIAELYNGAPDDVAAELVKETEMREARFTELEKNRLKFGILDKDDVDRIIIQTEEKIRQDHKLMGDVKVERSDNGFNITYNELVEDVDALGNPLAKPRVRQQNVKATFTVDDIDESIKLADDEYSSQFLLLDPNARMSGRLRTWFVSNVEQLSREQNKVIGALKGAMEDSFKGLNKRSAMNVDRVLQIGSKEGREFDYDALVKQGVGPEGIKLKPKEAKAYIGMRHVVSKMYDIENARLVDEYLANGVKLAELPDGSTLAAKSWDSAEGAYNGFRRMDASSRHIAILDDGLEVTAGKGVLPLDKVDDLTKEMVEDWYNKGFKLIRNYSDSSLIKAGDSSYQWALVRAHKVNSAEGKRLINRIPGYMPRSRSNSFFFIKQKKTTSVAGSKKGIPITSTVAWSDNVGDAEKHAKMLNDRILAENPEMDPRDLPYEVVFDREMTSFERNHEVMRTRGGGMFTGARKEGEIEEVLPFVGEDGYFRYENSFETMQRYINHVGRQMPISLYRLGAERRLLSIAKGMGVESKNLQSVLKDAEKRFGNKAHKDYKTLKDIHDQVMYLNMIPSDDEVQWGQRLQNLGKMLETDNPALKQLSKPFVRMAYNGASRNFDPGAFLRRITFTHMLGGYNPAQLLVQASGAFAAFAVNPVHFGKSLPKMVGWHSLDLVAGDPIAQRKVIEHMRKSGLADYADEYDIWVKSGFRESVIDSNADFATLFGSKPYDAGVLQRALANNDLFFRMGELTVSRASVSTAIEWYKGTKGLKKIDLNDQEALNAIFKRAEQYRLNMSNANKSDLNKGMKAVPLQFQQVISKYYEKVLPKGFGGTDEFTWAEKARLFSFPAAAFGTVGFPFGDAILNQFADLTGLDLEEFSPQDVQRIRTGLFGWAMGEGLGVNIDFSTRMSLGSDFTKQMFEGLTYGKEFYMGLLGPSGNIGDRYITNLSYVTEAFDLYSRTPGPVTADEAIGMAGILADAGLGIFSSTNNAKTYISYMLNNSPAFKKDGVYIMDAETINTQTAFFGIVGFQAQEIADAYELGKTIKDSAGAFNKFGTTDAKLIARILDNSIFSTESLEQKELGQKLISAMIDKYGPHEQTKLMKQVWKHLHTPSIRQDSLFLKFLYELNTRVEEDLNFTNGIIARKQEAYRANN